MGAGKYFTVLLLSILSFLGIVLVNMSLTERLFVYQLYFVLLLLIVVAVSLYSVRRNLRLGWLLFALFFAAVLFNAVYLHNLVGLSSAMLFVILVASTIGFLMSISNIGRKHRKTRPRIIIEDLPPEIVEPEPEKPAKKTPKKKAAKKPSKKTAKKKTAKKPAKRNPRKSTRQKAG
jgi:hypothetical protein